jgi:poly(A) polymerase
MPQIFKVGGCVRDELLGLQSKDIDFTFVLDDLDQTVEQGFSQMETWMKKEGFQIFLSTPEMFTVRAKFPKGDKNEGLVADFVMARKETGYIPDTRRPVLALGTLEDDLLRRDFTINAMAVDEDGKLIDLFDGVSDLQKGLLRTPLPAAQTMLDDPLRLLRAIRFSITKGFEIDPSIWKLFTDDEVLKKLELVVSQDRIREELTKCFKHSTIETMRILIVLPLLTKISFQNGLWLMPTTKI